MIIYLEDKGQDFLYFRLDESSKIVETMPFQGFVWNGKTIRKSSIGIGKYPVLVSPNGEANGLRYRIEKIEA